jgi:hypothetical protein
MAEGRIEDRQVTVPVFAAVGLLAYNPWLGRRRSAPFLSRAILPD